MLKLINFENYPDMCKKAASIIAAQIIMKENSVLGLATGSTPIGIYELLSEWCAKGDLDFSRIRTVNLDEYCGLSAAHDQSYRYFMNKHLFDNVNIDKVNTHVPNGLAQDAEREGAKYDELIELLGGIDLQLLGIGHNGHIGFNEPSDFFVSGTHCAKLTQETINANVRFFDDLSQVPKTAVTMGMRSIMNARKILLVANGDKKKDIIQKAINGPVTPKVPASILQLHPDVTILYSIA